jgi:L,D-transpeptidase catalytic domain
MKMFTHSYGKLFYLTLLMVPSTLVVGKKETATETSPRSTYFSVYRFAAAKVVDAKATAAKVAMEKLAIARAAAKVAAAARASARKAELRLVTMEAVGMFEEMQLRDSGLNQKALLYALLGYHRLLKRGILHRKDVLSICDFSQSSSVKRMYVIDVRHRKLLYRTYVAHGANSGEEYAHSFSNRPESHKSSLGFYVTRSTYFGSNGLSLRIDGIDRGFNTMANQRNIVIHGACYVSERILHKYGMIGTTFGCPAIPTEMSRQIIPLLKNGSCFFIYYPSNRYLSHSTVLNG